ncbi:MAG: hypothetical protein E7415_00835 [Ruminococcaceae bacterium]|nr:hypothetical protein [Oscillospiraceae bacterium]
MFNAFIMTAVCIFAVYGVIKLVFYIYGYFLTLYGSDGIKRHTVMFFKNNEDEAEVSIREVVLGRNPFCGDIIAVNMDSEDDTFEILRRLEREYDILTVMNIDEYIHYIKE